jgi:hypothetical protein
VAVSRTTIEPTQYFLRVNIDRPFLAADGTQPLPSRPPSCEQPRYRPNDPGSTTVRPPIAR